MKTRAVWWLVAQLCLVIGLSACGSTPKNRVNEADLARYADLSPRDIVNDAQAKLVEARQQELDIYAPRSFKSADDQVAKAGELLNEKKSRDKIILFVASAEQDLKRGYQVKDQVLTLLADVRKLDGDLKKLDAPTVEPIRYKMLSVRYAHLVLKVEAGDTDQVSKAEPELRSDMEALKIVIIKENALGEAKKLLLGMNSRNEKQYAPVAVQDANTVFNQADAFIQTNYDDAEGVAQAAHATMSTVLRAQNIVDRVKDLHNKSYPKLEQFVIEEESWLNQIGQAIENDSNPGLTLAQQAALHTQAILGLKTRADNAERTSATKHTLLKEHEQSLEALRSAADVSADMIQRLEQENAKLKSQIAGSTTDETVAGSLSQDGVNPQGENQAELGTINASEQAPVEAPDQTSRTQTDSGLLQSGL